MAVTTVQEGVPFNLQIKQGATFQKSILWRSLAGTLVDLTGFSAKAQVRVNYASEDPMLSFDSADGSIELGGVAGTIILNASAEDTASLVRSGVWDLKLTDGAGTVTFLLEGKVKCLPEVTR
jgi:hypothetical protein